MAGNAIAGSRNDLCPSYAPPPPLYGPASAFYAPPPSPPPSDGGLDHWLDSLRGRVASDRSAGFLTNHQMRSLDGQLGQLHESVAQLVWQDGGSLNPPDYGYLHNRVSGFIDQLAGLEAQGR